MAGRHGWDEAGLQTLVSPSIGTSIGILIQELTQPGDGVILQPPVFTDFKALVASSGRTVARNALLFESDRYRIDFDGLAATASDPRNRVLILCSPHNPVGRVWTYDELATVATICAENDVFVVADEIHADIMMPGHQFVPFARAATHGPIKTFGLAGVCETLLITSDEGVAGAFQSRSSQLHLTRNNVFGLAAFEAAHQQGGEWFDQFVLLLAENSSHASRTAPGACESGGNPGDLPCVAGPEGPRAGCARGGEVVGIRGGDGGQPRPLVRSRRCRVRPCDDRCASIHHRTGD
ncbi:MAG: aminotransferase class I/II-fold pyridoxal phosphate-dependent enzyme [Actinomycetia bacterium]|nr:aminotransferase class I/II-fold pyridoxal phosphate-dependent enzyme [Actinomycetes bacterium]